MSECFFFALSIAIQQNKKKTVAISHYQTRFKNQSNNIGITTLYRHNDYPESAKPVMRPREGENLDTKEKKETIL